MFSLDSKKENVRNTPNMMLKQGLNKGIPTDQRKTLQVLQQTPDNRLTRTPAQLLQGGKGSSQSLKKKVFPIFKDPSQTSSPRTQPKKAAPCIHASSQTEGESCCHCTCHEDEEDEAFRLMGQEEIPEDYWKDLAENRRQALEDSLHENEFLHESVDELRKENKRLSELAEHAEYFANILKEITDKEESDPESESEGQTEVKDTETTEERLEDVEETGTDNTSSETSDESYSEESTEETVHKDCQGESEGRNETEESCEESKQE